MSADGLSFGLAGSAPHLPTPAALAGLASLLIAPPAPASFEQEQQRTHPPVHQHVDGDAQGTRIGCAGWSIAAASAGEFAGEGSHLERYARVLGAVEINSSFYRPHRPTTYARWAAGTPDGFRFSVKLPRSVTHDKRLIDAAPELARFCTEVAALGSRLGCILIQLPPSLAFDAAVAAAFFLQLEDSLSSSIADTGVGAETRMPLDMSLDLGLDGKSDASPVARGIACRIALEARHPSWFAAPATALLRTRGIIRVMADPAAGQPGAHEPTSDALYLRLHGAPQRYYSAYGDAYLESLARQIDALRAAGHVLWCIFDNTAAGAALPNALAVQRGLQLGSG